MRCLIFARSADALWTGNYFPGLDPYLLKIVNKPLLEYYIDFAALLELTEVRIVTDRSIMDIEDWFKNGEKWGLKISYALARSEDNIKQVYLKNMSYCKEDDLLIFQGYSFPDYDKLIVAKIGLDSFDEGSYLDERIYCLRKNSMINHILPAKLPEGCCLSLKPLYAIQDYYNLCMQILRYQNRHFVLPGYSNEDDAFYGSNLIYPHGSIVAKPIMIGNNVRFQNKTQIGPNAVIGNNVIIDEGTTITNSIIYDDTYVGSELELHEKIVYKSNLISGINGECMHVDEKYLISAVDKGIFLSYFDRILQLVISSVLICFTALPWLLTRLLMGISGKWSERYSDFYLSKNFQTIQMPDAEKLNQTLTGKLMTRLCIDKFPLLLQLFRGRLILVGNHRFKANQQNHKLITNLPLYQPGVFSLAESMGSASGMEDEFIELEFLNTRCWRKNLKIMVRVYWGRLIYGYQ